MVREPLVTLTAIQNTGNINTQDLSFILNNDMSDSKLSTENSYDSLIITFNFGYSNPSNFHFIKNDYTSNNIFMMQWGNETFNYTNQLFQGKREIKMVEHPKITTIDEVRRNTKLLMIQRESSGLAKADVAFYDGLTYYNKDGKFFVQWLLLLESNAYNSFSTAFSAISLGSKVTFS